MSDIGDAIRAAREARRWSQGELAKRAEVDIKTVGRIERGEVKNPSKAGQLQRALQIGIYAPPAEQLRPHDPPLSEATVPELAAALVTKWAQDVRAADTANGIRIRSREDLPDHVQAAIDEHRKHTSIDGPSGGNSTG